MQSQSLDNDEILEIRWANEDPNPVSKEKEESKMSDELMKALSEKRAQEDPLYNYQNEVDHFPSQYDATAYPNTDGQYGDTNQYSNSGRVLSELLKEVELVQYHDLFLSAGYFDIDTLRQLDEIGLDAIGVTEPQHREKLLEAVKKLPEQESIQNEYNNYYGYSAPQVYLYNAEYSGEQPQTYGTEYTDYNTQYNAEYSGEQPKQTPQNLVDY